MKLLVRIPMKLKMKEITMSEYYKVADNKKIRVIIDTDAACEADDQYAIAHAFYAPQAAIANK